MIYIIYKIIYATINATYTLSLSLSWNYQQFLSYTITNNFYFNQHGIDRAPLDYHHLISWRVKH